MTDSKPTPENGHEGVGLEIKICSFLKAARLMRLRAAPPSTRIWYNLMLAMVGEMSSRSCLALAMFLGAVRGIEADRRLHPLVVGHCPMRRCGHRHRSAQSLDDTSGRNVTRTPVHDVERLVMLVGAGIGVGVAIDGLQRPLVVLEFHLLILVLHRIHLLFALPLVATNVSVACRIAPQAS
jgi:hypothetical protein